MQLTLTGLRDPAPWKEAGIRLPVYSIPAMRAASHAAKSPGLCVHAQAGAAVVMEGADGAAPFATALQGAQLSGVERLRIGQAAAVEARSR